MGRRRPQTTRCSASQAAESACIAATRAGPSGCETSVPRPGPRAFRGFSRRPPSNRCPKRVREWGQAPRLIAHSAGCPAVAGSQSPFSHNALSRTEHVTTVDAANRPRDTVSLSRAALVTLILPLGLYAAAAVGAGMADAQSPANVVCFDPARYHALSGARIALAAMMGAAAVTFLFVVPGLLGVLAFARWPSTRSTAHAWSLAVNSAALILVCLVLRSTLGIERNSIIAGWLVWSAALLAMAWDPARSPELLACLGRRYLAGLAIGLVAAVASAWVFFPEQFLQCFTLDGTESYELARSLKGHFLPYWELETWHWQQGNQLGTVVVNPALVNSYWTFALQCLLGVKELPTRLPYWVWWMAVFAAAW